MKTIEANKNLIGRRCECIFTGMMVTGVIDAIKGGREAGGRYNQKEKELLKKTIRELPNIQLRGARGLDWSN